ncbi:MAG: HNH endonuclease signature motif containing protein [Mycobacterium sp.]|nr:HNH endonuclease signature motif containing protein [Mycobacterium sp.]HKI43508.1 HNH endonuclease signature motif containing protein [Mycobacterium sp.]
MRSSSPEDIAADFAALHEVVSRIVEHSYEALTTPERLTYLELLEREKRRLPAACHELINRIDRQATPAEIGGKLAHVLADRLRITRSEAKRRIDEAQDLGARQALTGEPLAPRYPATAAAQRAGLIGAAQVAVIRHFFDELPCWMDAPTREAAEADLARWASEHGPESLRKAADRLACYLNPDGEFSDEDRARRRGLTLGTQQSDGMSRLTGWLSPQARATVEAALAKLAAPGMCNPDDPSPTLDGAPSEEAVQGDTRSPAQRNHDGLTAALRAMLASGELGQHNGLPASIVVTTTLTDLEAAAGKGLTGGGTLLPMSDVIRLARHAHHYLAIFDKGKALALYHTKRLASPGQRIVLYAKDRGCSAPGCDVAGYYCEVHHVQEWATTHRTDIDQLTLACGPHHRLLEKGWLTSKRANGDTEWVPPPHLDYGRPRTNAFHHPEKLLADEDGDDP